MIQNKLSISIIFITALFASPAWPQDAETEEALVQTQEHLKDSGKRKELIKDGNAKRIHESAASLVGEENVDEMYSIVAEIMPYVTKEANGDATKMTELMAEYQKDPQAFYKKLPTSVQNRIKALSSKVEKKAPAPGNKKAP